MGNKFYFWTTFVKIQYYKKSKLFFFTLYISKIFNINRLTSSL